MSTSPVTTEEQCYLDILRYTLDHGVKRDDRTGVGTIGIFGAQMHFSLRKNFPLLTTKKVPWRVLVSELLWFIEGSGDERRLAEILYNKDRTDLEDKTTIWTQNAQADYWNHKAKFNGDCGRIYGVQWRRWKTPVFVGDICNGYREVDQLANLIEGIKKDPYGRRHILSAWNPGELDQMALPPCHMMAQFDVRNGELSCLMTQRSGDLFLGIPLNIASYSLLTLMIAQVCGLKPGKFILSVGDAHIYNNHIEQVNEQLSRDTRSLPYVVLNSNISDINKFEMGDVMLHDYHPHPVIKAPMAV